MAMLSPDALFRFGALSAARRTVLTNNQPHLRCGAIAGECGFRTEAGSRPGELNALFASVVQSGMV